MPVLARAIESAGISTVLVTMMPFWAAKFGAPRTLGVEFPFGHTLGRAGARDEQLAVIRRALGLLEDAQSPGAIEDYEGEWQGDFDEWRKRWQPSEPSPIIKFIRERAQQQAQERRQTGEGA